MKVCHSLFPLLCVCICVNYFFYHCESCGSFTRCRRMCFTFVASCREKDVCYLDCHNYTQFFPVRFQVNEILRWKKSKLWLHAIYSMQPHDCTVRKECACAVRLCSSKVSLSVLVEWAGEHFIYYTRLRKSFVRLYNTPGTVSSVHVHVYT